MFKTVFSKEREVVGPVDFSFVGVEQGQEARVALLRDWHWYSLPGEAKRHFVKVFDESGDKALYLISPHPWETFSPEQAMGVVAEWLDADFISHPNSHHHLFLPMIRQPLFEMKVITPDERHLAMLRQEPPLPPELAQRIEIRFQLPLLFWLLDHGTTTDQVLLVGICR